MTTDRPWESKSSAIYIHIIWHTRAAPGTLLAPRKTVEERVRDVLLRPPRRENVLTSEMKRFQYTNNVITVLAYNLVFGTPHVIGLVS